MRLFILDLATRNQRRVGTPGPWLDENPSWSHAGRRIVFSSTRGGGGNLDIWLMDADGSNLTRLTDHPLLDQDPVFAHDDRSVFFASERDGRSEIYRVWLHDRRVDRLTRGIDRAIMPAVSTDGRYLAFAAQTIMNFQVHLFDLSAGTSQQITSGGGACRPSFAPGSREVAFVRIAREPSRLETVRESGTRVVVEDRKLWSYYPDYSPDGRYLVFSVSPEHHEGEDWDLALTDLTVPGRFVLLTTGPGNDRVPVWRPPLR
jgi:TolB protein